MSLRVLLADESDTIKKVFQLALQDLNAEVKSVHSGLDVIDVAKSFKPDIIFADVLLQKKNGYEICLQIKQSLDLKNTPVVLMWSSFMELDQDQFKKSLANDQLEKPFDADLLREMVKKHTTAVDANPMAQFLNFPKNIAVEAPTENTHKGSSGISMPFELSSPSHPEPTVLVETTLEENTSEFNLNAILGDAQEIDAFTEPPTSGGGKKSLFDDLAIDASGTTNQESWKEKDLSPFQLSPDKSDELDQFEALNLGTNSPSDSGDFGANSSPTLTPQPEKSFDQFSLSKTVLPSKDHSSAATKPVSKKSSSSSGPTISSMAGMNDSEIEAIVRAHTEEVIKNQIQDSLIHVVEKIVREELNRIMEEELRLQQDADVES